MRQIIKEGRLRRLGSVMALDYSFTFSIIQPQVRLTLARKLYGKFRLLKLLKYISIRSLSQESTAEVIRKRWREIEKIRNKSG